jgi:transposase
MALGRREEESQVEWVSSGDLPKSPGHPFYIQLNRLLKEERFDAFCEELCAEYYAERQGRPSIPPGTYFRMILVGYFEGIGSQRGIAWRCSDSLALRAFLGLPLTRKAPDHSSLTVIRQRLPLEVHMMVFAKVLAIAEKHGLVKGGTVLVDSTTLEANAAMKSIVRRDTEEDWKQYLAGLMQAEGMENPTDEDLRRFDKKRKNKKVSNKEWKSPSDPDSRIMKMKDGRTHLGYKMEHALDAESGVVVAVEVYHGDEADSATLLRTLERVEENLESVDVERGVNEVVADKGYHKAETLAELEAQGIRGYIAKPEEAHRRKWTDKPPEHQRAFHANTRRWKESKGKRLQRKRSELTERGFAHDCETGGGRRSWLRGLIDVTKRTLFRGAARNLGIIMRNCYGVGTPRSLQGKGNRALGGPDVLHAACCALITSMWLCGVWCWTRIVRALHLQQLRFAPC